MGMFSMTSEALTKIFKKIKDEVALKSDLAVKDYYIITAALKGLKMVNISNLSQTTTKYNYGTILHYGSVKRYYFSNGSSNVEITTSNLRMLLGSVLAPHVVIPSSCWNETPFVNTCGQIGAIAKGETVNSRTKWILFMNSDSEDQTYAASSSSKYGYYGSHTVKYGFYSQPWEIWLPSSASLKSVKIEY